MCICTAAQEPLLIVGPPGTAKSDLVTKFCQSLSLSADEHRLDLRLFVSSHRDAVR